jgi:predicted nucleic acid-binding protein
MARSSGKDRLFLDTTVIVSGLTKRNRASYDLLLKYEAELYTNEYVLKECIRVLKDEFGFSADLVNRALDSIRFRCKVMPTPNKKEFRKISISDKADRPVVSSAMKKGCILVIDDFRTPIKMQRNTLRPGGPGR